MPTELLTVRKVASEVGISRQAFEKHDVEPDFVANGRKLFLQQSVERIKGALVLNRLRQNKKP
jgi:hypothetical protein